MSKEYKGGKLFYGNEISEYGLQHNRVDYRALAKSFNGVLNNDIIPVLSNAGYYFDLLQGGTDNSEEIEEIERKMEKIRDSLHYLETENQEDTEEYEELLEELEELEDEQRDLEDEQYNLPECFQYYIIDYAGYDILSYWLPTEVIYYCESLDMYVWGVSHWGTSWDYVLTDIKIA